MSEPASALPSAKLKVNATGSGVGYGCELDGYVHRPRYHGTHRMELKQLRYLVAIIDAGSLSRAAALVHVAQPALSLQIAALEAELGTKLLDRNPAGVVPLLRVKPRSWPQLWCSDMFGLVPARRLTRKRAHKTRNWGMILRCLGAVEHAVVAFYLADPRGQARGVQIASNCHALHVVHGIE